MKKLIVIGIVATLWWGAPANAQTVTTLLDGTGVGSPELTSGSFTPTAGHAVVVALSASTKVTLSLTTSGYTWACSAVYEGNIAGNPVQWCWAFNVPSGAKTFATTGLSADGLGYKVLDVSQLNGTQDQTGTNNSTGTGALTVTTNGSVVQDAELGLALVNSNTAGSGQTPVTGWTAKAEVNASSVNAGFLDVDFNVNLGTSGNAKTGGYTTGLGALLNGQIITFEVTQPTATPTASPTATATATATPTASPTATATATASPTPTPTASATPTATATPATPTATATATATPTASATATRTATATATSTATATPTATVTATPTATVTPFIINDLGPAAGATPGAPVPIAACSAGATQVIEGSRSNTTWTVVCAAAANCELGDSQNDAPVIEPGVGIGFPFNANVYINEASLGLGSAVVVDRMDCCGVAGTTTCATWRE